MCVACAAGTMPLRTFVVSALELMATALLSAGCNRTRNADGERLARVYCAACHTFPDPALLDKKTWESGVLPQMARRTGVQAKSLFEETSQSPYMITLSG